jgi:nicotinate-nucleotide adenylyltransferase
MDIKKSHVDPLESFKEQPIALMGGSFDPFHNAHRMLAKSAIDALPVEVLLVMPLGWAPHKTTRMRMAAFRYEMSVRGVLGVPKVLVSDEEIKTPAISYTFDTVTHLFNKIMPDPLYLVIGSDSFEALPSWYRYKELARKVVFAVARRGDDNMEKMRELAERYRQDDDARVVFFNMPPSSLSSSNLRTALQQGKSVYGDCPDKVVDLINTYRIYDFQDEYDALTQEAWNRVRSAEQVAWRYYTQKQRLHAVSVAQYAARLALANGVDIEKAFVAGLLHDAAKNLPAKERRFLAEGYLTNHPFAKNAAKIVNDLSFVNEKNTHSTFQTTRTEVVYGKDDGCSCSVQMESSSCLKMNDSALWASSLSKNILHGPAGAMLAKKIFGVDDPDILDSICFHSTARPSMTSLEKVLYLSDKISYDRSFVRLEPIRDRALHGDLNGAMRLCLDETFVALKRKEKNPHPLSIAAYHDLG